MYCFNYSCPFRVNQSSNFHQCECIACPNACKDSFTITSNRTLTEEDIRELQRKQLRDLI